MRCSSAGSERVVRQLPSRSSASFVAALLVVTALATADAAPPASPSPSPSPNRRGDADGDGVLDAHDFCPASKSVTVDRCVPPP